MVSTSASERIGSVLSASSSMVMLLNRPKTCFGELIRTVRFDWYWGTALRPEKYAPAPTRVVNSKTRAQ